MGERSVEGESISSQDVHSTAHVGARIRALREARGMSVRQLGRATGMSASRISALERAPLPNVGLRRLLRLRGALKVGTLEELLGEMPSAKFDRVERST